MFEISWSGTHPTPPETGRSIGSGPRWPIGAPGGFLMPGCPDAWIARMAKIARMAELDCPDARMAKIARMASGHGQRPWPLAMATGLWPWALAMATGHGPWPWPWPGAMPHDHDHWPWPVAMARGLEPWPLVMARGHGSWPWPGLSGGEAIPRQSHHPVIKTGAQNIIRTHVFGLKLVATARPYETIID